MKKLGEVEEFTVGVASSGLSIAFDGWERKSTVAESG